MPTAHLKMANARKDFVSVTTAGKAPPANTEVCKIINK